MNELFKSFDWQLELMMAGRALFAALLGLVVGLERKYHHHEAGGRTYAAVSLGACMFAMISSHIPGADPSRMAANIVVGIGFIGAGAILHMGVRTQGLTTAASLWVIAAIGTCVGFGMYVLPVIAAMITLSLLASHYILPSTRDVNGGNGKEGEARHG